MSLSEITGIGINIDKNKGQREPLTSFYSLKATLINGETFSFEKLRNKQVLIVNVAGLCGYTPQFRELQELYQERSNLEILAFPSNDFANQEPGSNAEIAEFCERNFGITFRIFEKSKVRGEGKNEVYRWLTFASENGWNHIRPSWNFYKYLVDENGVLQFVAGPSVKPKKLELQK